MATRRRGRKRKNARKPLWRRLLTLVVILGLLGSVAGVAGVAGIFWHYGQGLPDIRSAQDYRPKQCTRVFAASGDVVATFADEDAIYRTVVPFEAIPEVMRDAIIAAEDADFYSHAGLDYVGLLRAVYTNVRRRQLSQGASTITQQVVKNLVLSPERTIRRKVQEALLAFRLEDRLTKDEILGIYLNQVFFGSRSYGVEAASRYYFGHSAAELELAEAALLAGLVQSPNRYNPHYNPEPALDRRSYVLRQMWEKGFISEADYREADDSTLVLDPEHGVGPYEGAFPFYVDAVRRQLFDELGEEVVLAGGLSVETGLDIELQAIAEDALKAGLREFDARHGYHTPFAVLDDDAAVAEWRREHAAESDTIGLRAGREYRAVILQVDDAATIVGVGPHTATLRRYPESRTRPDDRPWNELFPPRSAFTVTPAENYSLERLDGRDASDVIVDLLPSAEGALVAIEPGSRRVVALVGGYDFGHSPFNRAIQARRQVGSAFKPVVYAAALEARSVTPATVFLDQPVTFPMPEGQTWQPRNYDGEFDGPMSLRTALARSRNVIAVRVLDLVGLRTTHEFARRIGVESELTDNLTLALGSAELSPLEITNTFATFAADGAVDDPILVTRVTDPTGSVLLQLDPSPTPAVDPAVAWMISSLMRSVVERGTATRARAVGHPVAGKTGTTNAARDAWFLGFSRHLVGGVWVGRDDNETLGRREAGGRTALPIWTDFMTRAHADRDVVEFPDPPDGIVAVSVDPDRGLRAQPGREGAVTEYFLAGTEPSQFAPDLRDRAIEDILLDGYAAPERGSVDEGADPDGF